jgi:cell division protein FtsB
MTPDQENAKLELEALKAENAALSAENAALKAENAALSAEIARIKSQPKGKDSEQENTELKATVAKLEAKIESLQATEKDGLPRASGTFTIALQGLEDAKPVKRKYRIAAGTVKVRIGRQVFSAQEVVDAASTAGGSLPGVPDLAGELAALAAKKVAWLELV